MLTHGNNNEKRPVYKLLKHTQVNKKVNEYIDKVTSK